MAEKLITLARNKTLNNRRRVISILQDRRLVDEDQEFTGQKVVQKLFDELAPRFGDRPGGYTRIVKLSDYRIGDGGSLVLLQLLTEESAPRGTARRSAGLRRKRNERKHQFATRILKERREGAGKSEGAEAGATAVAEASETDAPAADGGDGGVKDGGAKADS
jgi:large subunit ribosomal protein L17